MEFWKQRQFLESLLLHPCFPATRQYTLARLTEWRQRGLANTMRSEWRSSDDMPTDGHILQNLIFKILDQYIDFSNCFLTYSSAPPAAKHHGQSPTAYLRQVTDQSHFPRPPPHYEVVTPTKAWKLRPGNSNLLEGLALLLHALRRHSRSYNSFPQTFRAAVEITGSTGMQARGFPWF